MNPPYRILPITAAALMRPLGPTILHGVGGVADIGGQKGGGTYNTHMVGWTCPALSHEIRPNTVIKRILTGQFYHVAVVLCWY